MSGAVLLGLHGLIDIATQLLGHLVNCWCYLFAPMTHHSDDPFRVDTSRGVERVRQKRAPADRMQGLLRG